MMLLPLLLLWIRSPMSFPPQARWALMVVLTLVFVGIHHPTGSVAEVPSDTDWRSDRSHLATARPLPSTPDDSPGMATKTAANREGTKIEAVQGRIMEIGRRWALVTGEDKRTYRILENLALERIARAIRLEPTDDRWSVSGTLTEFSGKNYLLLSVVTRASSDRSRDLSAGDAPEEAPIGDISSFVENQSK